MFTLRIVYPVWIGCALLTLFAAAALSADAADVPRLGIAASKDLAARWDTTVFPTGRGLPAGSGTVEQGRALYDEKCSSCHGPEGRGETAEELVGREEPLTAPDAAQTIGSYWPFATTLFDYTRRAMPMDKPGSMPANEVYAVTAYLLHLDGIIGAKDTMDAHSLPKVRMPNRDGFRRIDAR